jgi:glutathione S-transferase
MKLFLKPGACSLASHIALEEAGLAHTTEVVDLATKVTASGANFLEINPKGYVPALQLADGQVLTEGPAIMQYVADQMPAKGLAPANGTLDRYRLQGWLTFIGTELHRNFSAFFNPAAGDDWKKAAGAMLQRRLGYVNEQLEGKQYLMGDSFTVADGYLFTVLNWAGFIKLDLTPFAALTAYKARVGARPGVQAALKAEGLLG